MPSGHWALGRPGWKHWPDTCWSATTNPTRK
jgi:hypothetical protein